MAAWNSSSLAFSDHNTGRHSSGLLQNTPQRVSKRDITEHKMFGSNRGSHGKDIKIGKLFRKKGKGVIKSMGGMKPGKNMKYGSNVDSTNISPSTVEFDKMMSKISKDYKGSGSSKKMFSRKSFG